MLYSLAIILVLVYGIGKRYIHLFVDSISSCSSQSEQGCHTPCTVGELPDVLKRPSFPTRVNAREKEKEGRKRLLREKKFADQLKICRPHPPVIERNLFPAFL